MDIPTLIIWVLALILVVVSFLRPGRVYIEGFRKALDYIITMFPRVFMALLVSGFFSVLIPTDVVASWIGKEAGLKGILVGSFLGGFTPGGPLISFPIAFVLFKSGAGTPALIAFLTAWSVFAFHRVIAYEIPLVGSRFAAVRIGSSLILPPLAGIFAGIIEAALPAGG